MEWSHWNGLGEGQGLGRLGAAGGNVVMGGTAGIIAEALRYCFCYSVFYNMVSTSCRLIGMAGRTWGEALQSTASCFPLASRGGTMVLQTGVALPLAKKAIMVRLVNSSDPT